MRSILCLLTIRRQPVFLALLFWPLPFGLQPFLLLVSWPRPSF